MRPGPSVCVLLLASSAVWAADDATVLWRGDPWSFGWNERLGAVGEPSLVGGFGTLARPVATGWWGGAGVGVLASGVGRSAILPGLGPLQKGGQAEFTLHLAGAWGPLFIDLQPVLRTGLGSASDERPNGDPRAVWTGREPYADDSRSTLVPVATAGVRALRHVLAVGTEPVHWGPGIFNGVVLGPSERSAPHLRLTTAEPWNPLLLGSDPLFLRTDTVVGRLDDDRIGPSDPLLVGHRIGLRWRDLDLGFNVARIIGGSGVDRPSAGDAAWYPLWGPGDLDDTDGPDTVASVDVAVTMADAIRLGGEYGWDRKVKANDDHGTGGWAGPANAAWVVNLDWFDLWGDGTVRSAVEWARSEGHFYDHPLYGDGWTYRDQPLAGEGGDANSLRLLYQQRLGEDGDDLQLVLGWRRLGWRNADRGNPALAHDDPLSQAPRAWDTWSFHLRYSWDTAIGRAALLGILWADRNQDFTEAGTAVRGSAGLSLFKDF